MSSKTDGILVAATRLLTIPSSCPSAADESVAQKVTGFLAALGTGSKAAGSQTASTT